MTLIDDQTLAALAAAATAGPVPARYRGAWVRRLREAGDARDTSTQAWWLQTATRHAHLRIPSPRPGDIAGLAGSAGLTTVTRDPTRDASRDGRELCTWHRRIDLHPPSLAVASGHVALESPDRVVATSLDGGTLEVWERLPGSEAGSRVLVHDEGPGQRRTWALQAGGHAMRVRTRRVPWPDDTRPGETLAVVIARHPAQAAALRDLEISFGAVSPDGRRWIVLRSTDPALEGLDQPWGWRRTAPDEAEATDGSTWRVVEWEAGARVPLSG